MYYYVFIHHHISTLFDGIVLLCVGYVLGNEANIIYTVSQKNCASFIF